MEALIALIEKNAVEKVKTQDISGFLQQTFLGFKTQQMETYPRSELTKKYLLSETFKMEHQRVYIYI